MKVFYKGNYYNSVVDGLTVEDVNTNYGGFAEDDCYLPACENYCLIDLNGGTIVPEEGYYEEEEDLGATCCYDLGDVDIDLSDVESLVDLLHVAGVLVGPVEMFLIDQPMECDLIVDCKVNNEPHSVFVKLCDSVNSSKKDLQKKITDSTNSYAKRPTKEFLKDSLTNKARLFKYKSLAKCYITDESHVTATTNEGNSMLTKFDANDADSAAAYLEANEGQKIVKSDENGIYIGNESIDETSVRDIQEVNDTRYSRKGSKNVLDSFSKIFDKYRWSFVGDVRRGVPDFARVEVVVDSSRDNIAKRLKGIKGVRKIKDCQDCVYCECDGIPFEIYSAEGDSYIPALILMTGTDEFNVMFLANALESGCYFTEDGVFDEEGESYSFVDEKDCFDIVGLDYVEPTQRNIF